MRVDSSSTYSSRVVVPNLLSSKLHIEMEAEQAATEEKCKEGALAQLGQDELRVIVLRYAWGTCG